MKHRKRLLNGILCLFVGFTFTVNGQEEALFAFHSPIKTTKKIHKQQTISKTTIPHYYKHHKKLSLTYTGIVIELTTSDLPLKRNHYLFEQFGNIYYDKLDNGGYSYCILTNFKMPKKAQNYLDIAIIRRAPHAKVVKYQLGRRK